MSNNFKAHTVVNDGVAQEVVCRACRGRGDDPRQSGAACSTCWGDGTLLLPAHTQRETLLAGIDF